MADRKPEPNVLVDDPWADHRKALIDALDSENPKFKHSYQRFDVSERELKMKHQEAVREDGEILECPTGGDIVVRTPVEVWKKAKVLRNERSAQVVESANPDADLRRTRKPVEPKKQRKNR